MANPVHWVVQSNLGNEDDRRALNTAIRSKGHVPHEVKAVPFDTSPLQVSGLPSRVPVICYGAVGFIHRARSMPWTPGVFSSDELNCETYQRVYGTHYLNNRGQICTLSELHDNGWFEHSPQVFVRPVDDDKSFAGQPMQGRALQYWAATLQGQTIRGDLTITGGLKCLVAPIQDILEEWRLFIWNGRVITSSSYRKHGVLIRKPLQTEAPREVIAFAEAMHRQCWSPDVPLYVMDICTCEGKLQIVELGNFHSAGFYSCNIGDVVQAASSAAQMYRPTVKEMK